MLGSSMASGRQTGSRVRSTKQPWCSVYVQPPGLHPEPGWMWEHGKGSLSGTGSPWHAGSPWHVAGGPLIWQGREGAARQSAGADGCAWLCTGSWLPAHVMCLRGHSDISRGRKKKKKIPRDPQGALKRLSQKREQERQTSARSGGIKPGREGKVAGTGKGCEQKCWLAAGRMRWPVAEKRGQRPPATETAPPSAPAHRPRVPR